MPVRFCCQPAYCSTWCGDLPAEELSLELRPSEQDVELLCGSAIFHLRVLRAEDFPTLPDAADASQKSRSAFPPTRSCGLSRPASPPWRCHQTRPVLTGILISASDREWRMVATDSYRLSVKRTALDTLPAGSIGRANVPARALQELNPAAAGKILANSRARLAIKSSYLMTACSGRKR